MEEYVFHLYDVFAPARFVSGLVSSDRRTGFLVLNVGFLLAGLWTYLARVRPGHQSALSWIWVWVVIETVNSIGHLTITAIRGDYVPGAVTAPVLLALAIYLGTAAAMRRTNDPPSRQ